MSESDFVFDPEKYISGSDEINRKRGVIKRVYIDIYSLLHKRSLPPFGDFLSKDFCFDCNEKRTINRYNDNIQSGFKLEIETLRGTSLNGPTISRMLSLHISKRTGWPCNRMHHEYCEHKYLSSSIELSFHTHNLVEQVRIKIKEDVINIPHSLIPLVYVLLPECVSEILRILNVNVRVELEEHFRWFMHQCPVL